MQMLVVAAFVLVKVLMPVGDSPQPAPWWVLLASVAGYVAVAYGVSRWSSSLGLRRLMRPDGAPSALGRWPVGIALATQVYLLAALGGLMLAGWGGWTSRTLHLRYVPLLGDLLALAPFAIALMAHWWAIYPLEQAVRMRFRQEMALAGRPVPASWSRRQFLSFNVRHHLLFIIVPAAAIIFAVDLLVLLEEEGLVGPMTAWTAGLAAGAGVFLAAPAAIVRLWRARPMAAGNLRDRLEDLCRRARLRYRDIMVWDTGGVIVNAGVIGLWGRMRYLLLSDALLGLLDADAVEAVFAHEAGHIVHRHIPYMVLFTSGLLLLCTAIGGYVGSGLAVAECSVAVQVPTLLLAGVLWGWTFGMLSRRFEQQADVYAAAAPVGPDPADGPDPAALSARGVDLFGATLLAVARLNGISPRKRNFRHGSIQRRVEFLRALLAEGLGPDHVNRRVRRVKLAIWALFAAGVAANLPAHLAG